MAVPSAPLSLTYLHAAFLTILPRIERHALVYFWGLRCPSRKDDVIQETLGLAWLWFVRLIEKGKDPLSFPMILASYAARAVKCGRRICGQEKGKDVMSSLAQQRHGFGVETLPSSLISSFEERYSTAHGQHKQDAYEERSKDNTQTPVPDQVCFRIDFPAWSTKWRGTNAPST